MLEALIDAWSEEIREFHRQRCIPVPIAFSETVKTGTATAESIFLTKIDIP